MEIKEWNINPVLKKEINDHYRTKFAVTIRDEGVLNIVKKITFDNVAPQITINDAKNLIQYINKVFLKNKMSGVGLEVGAGCGFFSAIISNNSKVEKVYSLEICENIVKELMLKVVTEVGGENKNKVVACIGDFDNIELKDDSLDFIFDFYSLHHSPDIKVTFKELYRILKPGGFIICLDKARDNNLTDDELDDLLDKEYSEKAKENMGIPKGVFHTRRMNGEKEFRLKDWEQAFKLAGFNSIKHYNLARIHGKNTIIVFVKKVISKLPIFIQAYITRFLSLNGNKNNLEQSNKIYTPLIKNFPKEISVIIAYK